ncbi:hypothetical protein Pla110_10330 [Polystyrenella longa]|uniref:DUF58 domain-containing protein n=1 Tax=Polystyrenella longa TaxID=2528007 RepID=A0A518CJC3_9PLAN|nr:DUF58 domain-containing protein [Polystyrenella longa]QDU79325.1 hypothetical protein Pla110_10330 [Polystyrenella longa]
MSAPAEPLAFQDPSALASLGRLEVIARQLVEGFMVGQHRSPYKGASVEFVEHRQYYPGDEIRHIDWRAYGKTGKYYVKEFEEETNLRTYLLLDCSGSMGYSQNSLSKFSYARCLVAGLVYLLQKQRDAAGLIGFDDKIRLRREPSATAKVFEQLMHDLESLEPGGETSLAQVLTGLLPTFKRRSRIVLLSDCFDSLPDLCKLMQQLRHQRHEVMLLQIIAPEEEDFPFSKPTRFQSLEQTTDRKLVDPLQLRQHYLKQFESFIAELSQFCQNNDITYTRFTTKDPFAGALQAFLSEYNRR